MNKRPKFAQKIAKEKMSQKRNETEILLVDELNRLNREEDEVNQRLENTTRENEKNESLITNLTDQVERVVEERLPLRERIKNTFKEYGFTAFAFLSVVSVALGVLLSSLKSGLSTLGKGVGDGFKAVGKKLGEILPGIIGERASFIFKTAGEVISFLGKNAWLLVVAIVVYAVEQFKNKNKK